MKILLCITLFASASIWKEKTTPAPAPLTDRQKVIKVAEGEVGTREKTGKNDGDVEKYIAAVGLNPKAGYPYCGAFLSWCAIKALGKNQPYPVSAWSPDFARGGTRIKSGTPVKGGEAVTVYYSSKGRVGHVAFAVRRSGKYFETIEGNTSATAAIGSAEDREAGKGGGVYRKLRHWKTVYKLKDYLED